MVASLVVYGGSKHTLAGDEILVGRSQDADIRISDLGCSRKHFKLIHDAQANTWWIEPLSSSTVTRVNGKPICERTLILDECEIQAGTSRLRFSHPESACRASDDLGNEEQPDSSTLLTDHTVLADLSDPFPQQIAELNLNIPLREQTIRLGRDATVAEVVLNHCYVSRCHAEITYANNGYHLRDMGSANGTLLNGVAIRERQLLSPGDQIRIGPYVAIFSADKLLVREVSNRGRLVCEGVSRYPRQGISRRKKILSNISLAIDPSEFVCLLGPTGSGKSTLLSALCLKSPADEGTVWLNDLDLTDNFEFLKHRIAVVPQKEILHSELTVAQALRYTAGLRLPPDTTATEIERLVRHMCSVVGLTDHQNKRYRDLSGGQAKRACLANELIANPEVLFLDEVTAGLDEQTDREIMRLFRRIADTGKTVVAVTHNLANIEENCDLLVVLTVDGKLAFVGSPQEALSYFDVSRLGDIYPLLTDPAHGDWEHRFRQTPEFQRYVTERLSESRRTHQHSQAGKRQSVWESTSRFVRQVHLLVKRAVQIKLADWQSLLALAGQCLLVALLLLVVFGDLAEVRTSALERLGEAVPKQLGELLIRSDYSTKILFLMAVCCFWFGCNNASKELVVERAIYSRERDVNLSVEAYLSSKFILLCGLTLAQTAVLLGLGAWLCSLEGPLPTYLIVLSMTSLCGVGVGLCISSLSQSEDMAVKLVPICLIPQIILGGILAPISGLGSWIVAGFIPTYWCFTSSCGSLPDNLAEHITIDTHGTALPLAVIGGQLCIALLTAWLALKYQQSRDGLYEYGIKQLARGGRGVTTVTSKLMPLGKQLVNQRLKAVELVKSFDPRQFSK
ncbi:MAG: ATP-binding cassette domain-containing protein [Planctomycetales bacterium]|nr:ATP-binding cassette domain-containing protein [Planctomycetales bacterium]